MAYRFSGYWRDVGTLDSLHAANMELLPSAGKDDIIHFSEFPTVFSEDTHSMPQYIGKDAIIEDSLINQGAIVLGQVSESVISNETMIDRNAKVIRSCVMPGATIGKGAYVENAIVGPHVKVKDGEVIAQMPLPYAGLMTGEPAEQAAAENALVRDSVHALGVPAGRELFMTMSFISLPVIPHLKLTTLGLVDVDRQIRVPLLMKEE